MRASLKGRHSTKDGRTRHRVHSKPKTHKGAAVKDSGSNTDSLDLSNYCPSDLILKRIYLRRTATPLAAWPSGRADADRGGSRSRCGSLRYATDGLLLSRDTTAAVPSAGRDAAAREAASTAPAGPYRRYMP
eukprot:COSAG06_NODE_24_length_32981_cov_25.509671_20_plen_132_part_00